MSYFAQNLKKIRLAKKLNQTDFANLFGLTRSAVGAYEEQRAEPKIDKIIEIANYFGIDVGKLIANKLTINEILKYDINKLEQISIDKNLTIPFVDKSRYKQYTDNYLSVEFIDRLPKIKIPDIDKSYRAFEFFDNSSYLNNEILICRPIELFTKQDALYLHITKQNPLLLQGKTIKLGVLEVWFVEFALIKNIWKLSINNFLENLKNKIDFLTDK